MSETNKKNRYRGCLLGLAAGDAVGTSVEFKPPGTFEPVTDMTGGGVFHLEPGQWTDDTSLALCLAESLIRSRGFDAKDQMKTYCRWFNEAHLSSNGEVFDVGGTTNDALLPFLSSGIVNAGEDTDDSNDSLMRLAAVPMFFAEHPAEAIERSGNSSRTTHGGICIDACRYMGALIAGALRGDSKEQLLADHYNPTGEEDYWLKHPLWPKIDVIASGSFKHKSPPSIKGSGYADKALEAALWAFYRSDSYRDGCLLAVNLGDDADTTGAIYGQLAGAFYGESGIPEEWRMKLALKKTIEKFAEEIYELARGIKTSA